MNISSIDLGNNFLGETAILKKSTCAFVRDVKNVKFDKLASMILGEASHLVNASEVAVIDYENIRSGNQTEELWQRSLFSIDNVTEATNESWYFKSVYKETSDTENTFPSWIFVPILATFALFIGFISFFIFTYYRKMMFAEFALSAINWRNSGMFERKLKTRFSSAISLNTLSSASSYLSVFSIFQESSRYGLNQPEEDEDETNDTYTTTSSRGTEPDEGDDSGYGFIVPIIIEHCEIRKRDQELADEIREIERINTIRSPRGFCVSLDAVHIWDE